jgi:hypothetical protein
MWRVKINLHYTDSVGVGFSNREKYHSKKLIFKKYFFIPYSLSIVLPFFSSVYYAFTKKTALAFLLWPLTIFTGAYISYQIFLKLIGIKPRLDAYGK